MWLLYTLVVFFLVKSITNRFNHPLSNPLIFSVAIIITTLVQFDVPFKEYNDQNWIINALLAPAVVALAYPLYEQLPEIRKNWKLILLACGFSSVLSMLIACSIAVFMGMNIELIASVLGKSVTTAIAMEVSAHYGGARAITASMVLLVGIVGALFAYPIYKRLGITHPIAKGLTMGSVSHAFGTAACVERDSEDAAFSSLALILCGIITSLIAPLVWYFVVFLNAIVNGA